MISISTQLYLQTAEHIYLQGNYINNIIYKKIITIHINNTVISTSTIGVPIVASFLQRNKSVSRPFYLDLSTVGFFNFDIGTTSIYTFYFQKTFTKSI